MISIEIFLSFGFCSHKSIVLFEEHVLNIKSEQKSLILRRNKTL